MMRDLVAYDLALSYLNEDQRVALAIEIDAGYYVASMDTTPSGRPTRFVLQHVNDHDRWRILDITENGWKLTIRA